MIQRAKRFGANWNVHLGHPTAGWVAGKIKDCSMTGASVLINARYPIGAETHIVIDIPGKSPVKGVIKFVRERFTPEGVIYGTKFVRFIENSKDALDKALLELLREDWAKK